VTEQTYPLAWEADVVLADGGIAHVRPIRADDADRLRDFHARLSPETVYFRFFAPHPELTDRDVERFTQVDHVDRVALVGTVHGEIVGVSRYERLAGSDDAEVAFVVRDDHQGRGLASVLLDHLAEAARERGVRSFVAEVMADNRRMLAVFADAGYRPNTSMADGYLELRFDIAPSTTSLAVASAREHCAESRSVERLLRPSSVAVVGAGRHPGSMGRTLLDHLLAGGFHGAVHAVNRVAARAGETIAGRPAYARVSEVPGGADLAVVAVPASELMDVVDDCAVAGVRGLVVVTAGFAGSGAGGRERRAELVVRTRAGGMRVIGPGCLGVVNPDPAVMLNASLSPALPAYGRVGLFCQSAALGGLLLATAADRQLGLSSFVSAGDRADVSANDLIQYWEDDPCTDLLMLHQETVGNPRKFARLAARTSLRKPIVAVRVPRQADAAGHPDRHRSVVPAVAVAAMFAQSGVIQVDEPSELFDVASVLMAGARPDGDRVCVVGNDDALAALAAEAISTHGLRLVGVHPLGSSWDGAADADRLEGVLPTAARDADAVVVTYLPPAGADATKVLARLEELAPTIARPVLVVVPGPPVAAARGRTGSVPCFSSVEAAVRALARVHGYGRWLRQPHGSAVEPTGLRVRTARSLVLAALADRPDGGVLPSETTAAVLACYGVHVEPTHLAPTAEAAVRAADRVGYPVVLKSWLPALRTRVDLGAVHLDLPDPDAVRQAHALVVQDLGPQAASSLVVQRMRGRGVACVVATTEDPRFGPVLSFGLGGVIAELVADRAYRAPPLSAHDAADLVRAPKAAPLLLGHRGTPSADLGALEDLLVRVGRLAFDVPELASLVLDPVLAGPSGAVVLGAAARVQAANPRDDSRVRRL
jgi:acyl-CoA synthetase (NDP forming)/GNAT superfamily N-acetyltransferase